ncbi:MAG: O-methyltransferase [Candidatus Kapabacteria bacterium]|nr:O-methyltransferase [Ignavibacteriota bacterium]MCW5883995.1 O-methyltransferase [Candidatus Kapabacteria bacterium]
MSQKPTPVDDRLFEYLKQNFSSEDDFLRNLVEEARTEGIPDISISPEQGLFMQFILKSIKARNILELGTLAGYSAITMARALPDDAKIITIENEFKHAVFAVKKVKEAGLENIIEVQNSDALEFLRIYNPENKFDFIFVDADKPNYARYLDFLTPMLRVGGIFAADNAFAFGFVASSAPERNPEDVKSITGFNNYFRNHEQYSVCMVPVGDGIIMGVKIK